MALRGRDAVKGCFAAIFENTYIKKNANESLKKQATTKENAADLTGDPPRFHLSA